MRTGFYTPEDALETAKEVAEYSGSDEAAQQALDTQLAQLSSEQAQWPDQTDCHKLDKALEKLEDQGIVARQNFSCCGTCGSTEIWDEVDAVQAEGNDVKGYVFYHMQDTENAVEGNGVFFNHVATDGRMAEDTARMLVEALKEAGLAPEWNGSVNTRVFVPLDWKRPVMNEHAAPTP